MRNVTKMAAVIAALATLPASAVGADARPVALADARIAPSHIQAVAPGHVVSAGVCREESTDVSAYRRNGAALGEQVTTHDANGRTLFHSWAGSGGRVYLLRSASRGPGQWFNGTTRPVLVAVWCG